MSELKINEITFSNVDTSNPVLGAGAKHTRAESILLTNIIQL